MKNENTIFIGLDLSLNHWALVGIDNTSVKIKFSSQTKKYIKNNLGILSPKIKKELDFEDFNLKRIDKNYQTIVNTIKEWSKEKVFIVGLEGYSFCSVSRSILQIAELSGIIKFWIWENGNLRIHDPSSIKIFATGCGSATKKQVFDFVSKEYNIPSYLVKEEKDDIGGPATDICDAYVLAKMVQTEKELQDGKILLKDLPPYRRRIFLRTTKSNPINILGREFLYKFKQ